jgi:hypothetical protein
VVLQIAEEDRCILAANHLFPIAGDLLRRKVESEDAPVEVGSDKSGTNGGHDSFVQRAQVGQRLRCGEQANVRT